jgi:hypothetical protein
LLGDLKFKRPYAKPNNRQRDNIKMNLGGRRCEVWTGRLACDEKNGGFSYIVNIILYKFHYR